MKPRIVAIVPMRHTSERVPGKNYRSFAGQPLYRRIISTLLSCRDISEVVIDTDSNTIIQDAAEAFPGVGLYRRPKHLCDDQTPMNEVLLNSIKQVKADYYLQTHSTNPLLSSETVSKAIMSFTTQASEYDSLFTVTRLQTRLWSKEAMPLNHNPLVLLRTQDLEPVFEENSCMYIFSKDSFARQENRIGACPMMFEIDKLEAQDIDEENDFRIAEALYKQSLVQEFI